MDRNGNVYVTGFTLGGLDGNPNAGSEDLFLVKYDTDGYPLWAPPTRQLGTTADDAAHGVAVDGNGNVYVTGFSSGGLDGNPNAGLNDTFLVKYDAGGNIKWIRQWGTIGDDIATGVAVDGSGNVYVTGTTSNAGDYDMFLVKYDTDGNPLWTPPTRQLGTTDNDTAYGVACDSLGGVYVTGGTRGGLDGNTNTNAGVFDLFVVKYNSDGEKQ